jgi:RNA polymerase sigma-70 factor (ECF subfamily)
MHYNSLSDHELWQYCRQDDIKAYNELFNRYAPKLYRLGMRYLKNRFAVEELALDLLYNIWERRHLLEITDNLSSYLFRAMHYKAISYLRKAMPQQVSIAALPEDILSPGTGADQQLLYKESARLYQHQLNKLSPQRRKVFEMSREHSLSYADIAKELDLSVNTVENHMAAALAFLRRHYGKNTAAPLLLVLLTLP